MRTVHVHILLCYSIFLSALFHLTSTIYGYHVITMPISYARPEDTSSASFSWDSIFTRESSYSCTIYLAFRISKVSTSWAMHRLMMTSMILPWDIHHRQKCRSSVCSYEARRLLTGKGDGPIGFEREKCWNQWKDSTIAVGCIRYRWYSRNLLSVDFGFS